MAFFNIREWIDRISEHPNRRTLTNTEDATDVKTYDISRAEGEVSVQGTALTAANLNDLERRIGAAFTAVENAMPEANPAETATGSLTKLKVGGTVYEVEGGGGGTTIEKITKAEWDAMTAEEREAFIGVVEDTNADYVPLTADNIPYDSENSIAEKVEKLTVKLTLAEYNALTEKAPNTRYIITDAPALEYTAEDLSYDGGADTVWDKVEEKANSADLATVAFTGKYKDLTGLLTSLHTGSSVVEAGGSISLSESPSNFMYLLIRFQTNSECQYMVLSTSDNMTLQTTISGHGSQGTVTYPIAYNSTIGVKINGNKLDVINLVYNNVNYKARVSNVWGLIRTNA